MSQTRSTTILQPKQVFVGAKGAQVTLVEFGDYEDYCLRYLSASFGWMGGVKVFEKAGLGEAIGMRQKARVEIHPHILNKFNGHI